MHFSFKTLLVACLSFLSQEWKQMSKSRSQLIRMQNLMQSQQNLGGIPVLLCDYSIFANKDQTNSRTSNNAVYVSGCFRNCQECFYQSAFWH